MSQRKQTPSSKSGWKLQLNQPQVYREEEEEEDDYDSTTMWHVGLCCLGMLALLTGIAALIWLAVAGAGGSSGSAGDDCWDLNGNGVCDIATEDVDGSGTCNALDCSAILDDEFMLLTAIAPCECDTTAAVAIQCSTLFPGKLVKWFRDSTSSEFYCNINAGVSGQWWGVQKEYFLEDQNDGCNNGQDFSTDVDCAIEIGGDESSTRPRVGFFLDRDIVITGVSYEDDGSATATCAPVGSGDFALTTINSPSSAFSAYVPGVVIASAIQNSVYVNTVLNVPVQRKQWLGFQMINKCGIINDAISHWGVQIFYRETDKFY